MGAAAPNPHLGADLDTRAQVAEFVRRFYREIAQDGRFHYYFGNLASVDWHVHTGLLTDYWCGLLFGEPHDDADAVIEAHRWLDAARPFDSELFDRWREILDQTLDGGWDGPNTERARAKGYGLAWAMQKRLTSTRGPARP